MHLPEAPLQRRRLRRVCRRERVRVDLGQRIVAVGEAHVALELVLDALDFSDREARVRALVVAVHEDHGRARGAAHVVESLIERFQGRHAGHEQARYRSAEDRGSDAAAVATSEGKVARARNRSTPAATSAASMIRKLT